MPHGTCAGSRPQTRRRVEQREGSDARGADAAVRLPQGFRIYVEAEDADILVLTETKSGEPDISELSRRYPVSGGMPRLDLEAWRLTRGCFFCHQHRYWGTDPKKGNAGTAILSKIEPLAVVFGMPTTEAQSESAGRTSFPASSFVRTLSFTTTGIVTLEFEHTYVVGTCAFPPNNRSSPLGR